jgi:hypothetical protein
VTLMKMYENTGRLEEVEKMMRNVMLSWRITNVEQHFE